ncbi:MAG TPA: glucose 1-dehydrogenase [Acidobacteriota bacterium]|jgi:3-oxoacyl-[acyl-carrier protein] reductase|nr:glucose 1-dehydrogenase [Syntrophales bacterium]HQA82999.1 glucose 1-dehydrogenase [Syntrophales bacterium]HRT71648.1 glucose 1-dehydrogenase [Syntrophales bacterium]HXK61534.1 glucose 1-dehydrogenase [Acidobacteriota bacterium]
MGKLEGKTAVVTGGGRGVGRAICLAFAKEGANVVVNYAGNHKAAAEVVDMITKMGGKAVAVQGKVENKADAEKTIQTAIDNFGAIHILINNAGATNPAMLHKMTEEQWDEIVDIHMKGPFLLIQAAYKYFKQQNYGRIVNVTSVAGIVGTKGQVQYSAAKGGIVSFTKSVARELAGIGVTCNVISLGIVSTDMTEKITTDPKLKDIYAGRILLNRFADPEEVARPFVFFSSDDSSYITGQLLCVDGGYGMT